MGKTSSGSFVIKSSKGFIATFAALCLLAITATAAWANSVNIYDNAGVLNQSQVRSAASSLSKPIDIYAVNNSTTSNASFDQTAKSSIKNANMIVLAFNPHHVAIVGGKSVGLSTSQYQDATNAFINQMSGSKNYTSATVAAINSLNGSLNSSNSFIPGVGGGAGSSIGGTLCCVGLIALAIIAAFAFARRRRGGVGGLFNRRSGYNQPYQGNYPPNYQGPYPPQNQGMNPWAAGGLGAAAGGLAGYELGKAAGERDADRYGNGGDFGGGASGDFGGDGGFGGGDGGFGGGASGDFGGGGGGFGGDSGFGGGGDFGGGAGGDFGGGGGGGGDFGGGSSGSF